MYMGVVLYIYVPPGRDRPAGGHVHVNGGRAIHVRTSRKRSASRGSCTCTWGSCYTYTYLQEEIGQPGVVLEFQGESSQKLHLVRGYGTEVGLSTRTNQPLEGMEHMCADVTGTKTQLYFIVCGYPHANCTRVDIQYSNTLTGLQRGMSL